MYTTLGEIWRGWSKNTFIGMERNPFVAVGALAALFFLFVFPWLALPFLVWGAVSGSLSWTLVLPAIGVFVVLRLTYRLTFRALYHLETRYWWLEPLGFMVLMVIILNSAWLGLTGKTVRWRGREVS
jgi:hypothetical protein